MIPMLDIASPYVLEQLLAELIAGWHRWRLEVPPARLLGFVGALVGMLRSHQPKDVSPASWASWLDTMATVLEAPASPSLRLDAIGRLLAVRS